MRSGSLIGRLTLLHGAVIALSMSAFAGSALWLTGRVLFNEERSELQAAARRIGTDVDIDVTGGEALNASIREAMAEEAPSALRIRIFDPEGSLIGTSDPPPVSPPPGARPKSRRHAETAWHKESYISPHGVTVEASIPVTLRHRSLEALVRVMILVGIPLLVLAVLAERFITGRGLGPLERLTRRADTASAESGIRSLGDPVGLDEVDRLTAAFNRLLAGLDDVRRLEGRFAADASHELRTPLTVLLGELELAQSSLEAGDPASENIASARLQARKMSDLVDALLLLRRLGEHEHRQNLDFEAVNLADVAREVCQSQLAASPGRAADLTVHAADETFVAGHPGLLASAVSNLVDNALKFTRSGETVDVAVEADPKEVRVTVTDGGRGVRPEDVEGLFSPFFRGAEARSDTPGFGLGLPILRLVARAHGGDVVYRRASTGGACFVMSLPPWSGSVSRQLPSASVG